MLILWYEQFKWEYNFIIFRPTSRRGKNSFSPAQISNRWTSKESDSLHTREPWVGHWEDTDSMQLISVFKTETEEPLSSREGPRKSHPPWARLARPEQWLWPAWEIPTSFSFFYFLFSSQDGVPETWSPHDQINTVHQFHTLPLYILKFYFNRVPFTD